MSQPTIENQETNQAPQESKSWWEKAQRLNYFVGLGVRLWLAFGFLSYGIAKVIGTQFFHAGPELDQPARSLSGFGLTWIYFGYAPMYAKLIGVGQIASAILLVFDRTKRLGAMLLLPIVSNIVMVNYFYTINSYVMTLSTLFLLATLYVLLPDLKAIWRFFWAETDNAGKPDFLRARAPLMLGVGVVFIVGASIYHTRYFLASEAKARPLFYGDYVVVKPTKKLPNPSKAIALWDKVYLRHLGLFQAKRGKQKYIGRYRFEAKSKRFTLRYRLIGGKKRSYTRWQGRYKRTKQHLILQGKASNERRHLVLAPLVWPQKK